MKNQLTSELQHLTTSFSQLKQAQAKFGDCGNSVKDGLERGEGACEIFLVPLGGKGRKKEEEEEEEEEEMFGSTRWGKKREAEDQRRARAGYIYSGGRQTLIRWNYTGTPILVPLTPSLYVPGKLASTDTVLVDIGTGFYVEKVCLCRF